MKMGQSIGLMVVISGMNLQRMIPTFAPMV